METCQLSPDSLLLNNVGHQGPSLGCWFQILVIAHLQDDFPDALFGQFREAWMDVCIRFELNLTSNILDSFDGLQMCNPEILTSERLAPAPTRLEFQLQFDCITETYFWFSCSTSKRNWSTRPLKVLMCCLLSLTWIATSSIICRRVRCAPPLKLVKVIDWSDTKSFSSAQMYWNLFWLRTEERKSKRLTASPSPLKPAISRVQRNTIWQCGRGTDSNETSSDDGCPSVAFLKTKKLFWFLSNWYRFFFLHFFISWFINNSIWIHYTIAFSHLFVSHSSTFNFSQLPWSVFTHSSPCPRQSFEINGILRRPDFDSDDEK